MLTVRGQEAATGLVTALEAVAASQGPSPHMMGLPCHQLWASWDLPCSLGLSGPTRPLGTDRL